MYFFYHVTSLCLGRFRNNGLGAMRPWAREDGKIAENERVPVCDRRCTAAELSGKDFMSLSYFSIKDGAEAVGK